MSSTMVEKVSFRVVTVEPELEGGSSGCGLILLVWEAVEKGSTTHTPPALLFRKIDVRSRAHSFRPGSVRSGSARGDDCGRAFPNELLRDCLNCYFFALLVNSFPRQQRDFSGQALLAGFHSVHRVAVVVVWTVSSLISYLLLNNLRG